MPTWRATGPISWRDGGKNEGQYKPRSRSRGFLGLSGYWRRGRARLSHPGAWRRWASPFTPASGGLGTIGCVRTKDTFGWDIWAQCSVFVAPDLKTAVEIVVPSSL